MISSQVLPAYFALKGSSDPVQGLLDLAIQRELVRRKL
jgi:hypothetical protein